MMKVLFVCTGNTCRSPMAAAICQRLCPEYEVRSAGLFADGSAYAQNSMAVLKEIGITLSGNSRQLEKSDLDADRIFTMSEQQRAMLLSAVDGNKITVLDIPDPYGGDLEVYRKTRDDIKTALCDAFLTVRTMLEDDIPTVALLEKECFSAPWSETAIRETAENGGIFLVAECGEKVIGYMGATAVLDEAYVTNVAVKRECRGFGIGTELVNSMALLCKERGASFLTLEVRKSNAAAISVYGKAGFTAVGVRKNFYSNPSEDAVLMTKE